MRPLILDIATCPIEGVDAYIEEPTPPANYKNPELIASWIIDAKAKAATKAALDPDLGRIAMIGIGTETLICDDEQSERYALEDVADRLESVELLVGYNSLRFDWPFLMRRAMYLGVDLRINIDKYKSPHVDLLQVLTYRGVLQERSLGWYVRRLGWTDLVKPLSGAEEALAPSQGRWEELAASVRHDLEATRRLAIWLKVFGVETEKAFETREEPVL